MIGKNLGNRYRILRELGAGGMAKVYLAEDLKGSELIAVKILYPQFSEDISFIQRFIREAKLASTLTDPHIVRVIDYGADRDLHYLVMEYVEGQDLHDTLEKNGPFKWDYALELIDQLATALEHAHVHGVVHRDIKPQNMMLNDNGLLKVLDFGIARIPTLPSLTQSGFIGSPYYASPEQAMGEEVDIRSDIYSSGIVLYELLSGNIPFDAKSPWSIISQHITSEPPKIELPDGDEIPQNVRDFLNRMLAKRPEDRFQTPAMLRQAIASVLAGQPVPEDIEDPKSTLSLDKGALVESLHERAVQAMEAQEWARAVDLLSQAAQLAPDNTEIAEKLAEMEKEARLSSLYKTGSRAMASKRWEEALNHFKVIAELESDYKDVNQLLLQTHAALKQENTRHFITTRYGEGLTHFEAGRWENAVEAFREVHQLAPKYEKVEQLLAEAERLNNPSFVDKLKQRINTSKEMWRWGLVFAGSLVIIAGMFLLFNTNNQPLDPDNNKDQLKIFYEEAQQAIADGNEEVAIVKLGLILDEDPDYADAADIRRELMATPTPKPTPTTVILPTSAPTSDPLAELIEEAQSAVNIALWTEAIDLLTELRANDPDYQAARISSLFCDAYVGRGLEYIANIEDLDEKEVTTLALADFEAGATECPRRIDLKDQSERAAAYLEALNTPKDDFETLIPILTPVVAANPDYAGGNAKLLLYQSYLGRGTKRQESRDTFAAALGDYEAALALNVADPSEVQTRRAELLLAFSQPPPQPTPTPEPTATDDPDIKETSTPVVQNATSTPTPTPQPEIVIKYEQLNLISPADDTAFAGAFSEVILEWDPVEGLEKDEYYDITIMYIFADVPNYTGSTRTHEPRVELNSNIGFGEAGGDRFYWWVTVRKDNSAPTANSLDLPLSPQSEVRTFVWAP